MTAAAAPQVGGQAIRRVITPGHMHLVGHHVFGGHYLAEQRQRIVGGVTAGLGADLGEGVQLRAVLAACARRPAPPK